MIRYLEVSGTEYEMGFQLGQAFAAYLQSAALGMEETLAQGAIREKAERLEGKLKAQLPACLEEIYGRADGAKIPRSLALLLFFPEISKRADGCTAAVIQKENGKFLFCHNEDDEHYTTENVALVKYQYGDFWITGYTVATKLVGSSFAWNSARMVFSSNYIYDTKIQLENISRYVAVRDVMNAKSLEEAVQKPREAKVASAFSLRNLSDPHLRKIRQGQSFYCQNGGFAPAACLFGLSVRQSQCADCAGRSQNGLYFGFAVHFDV